MAKLWYVQINYPTPEGRVDKRTPLEEVPPIDVTVDGIHIKGWELIDPLPEKLLAPTYAYATRIDVEGVGVAVTGKGIQANRLYSGQLVITKPVVPRTIIFPPLAEMTFRALGLIQTVRAPQQFEKKLYSDIVVSEIKIVPGI